MTVVAVWGASGFAGRAIGEAAVSRGWTVRRLQREGSADAVSLDLDADTGRMQAALTGVDIAYHCAGKAGDGAVAGYARGTERFALACAAAGVRRLVYLGTVAVYGDAPASPVGVDTPLAGTSSYARSRIDAEALLRAALDDDRTQLAIVRVPMLVGPGMPGTLLRRLSRLWRLGVFLHPGREEAVLCCLGIRRLAALLTRLPADAPRVVQFADHVRWADMARRHAELHHRMVLRLRVPNPGGRFRVFDSLRRYQDDSERLLGDTSGLPLTTQDLDRVLGP